MKREERSECDRNYCRNFDRVLFGVLTGLAIIGALTVKGCNLCVNSYKKRTQNTTVLPPISHSAVR